MKTIIFYNNIFSNSIILRWDISILFIRINLQKVVSFKVLVFNNNNKYKITLKNFFLFQWNIFTSYFILYLFFISLVLPVLMREDFLISNYISSSYPLFLSFSICFLFFIINLNIKNQISIIYLIHTCILTIINLAFLFTIILFYSILIFDIDLYFIINTIDFLKSYRNIFILSYIIYIVYKEKRIFSLRILNFFLIFSIFSLFFWIVSLIGDFLLRDYFELLNNLENGYLLTGRNSGYGGSGGSEGSGGSGGGSGGPDPNFNYLRRLATLATEQFEQNRVETTSPNAESSTSVNSNSNSNSNINNNTITHESIGSLVQESIDWRNRRNLTSEQASDVIRHLRDQIIQKENLNRYGNDMVRVSFRDIGVEAQRLEKTPLERYLADLKRKDPEFFKEFKGKYSGKYGVMQYREKYITEELLNKIKNS